MDNKLFVGTFVIFLLVFVIIIVIRLIKPRKNRCNNIFLLMSLIVIGWFTSDLVRMTTRNIFIYNYSIRLGLIFMELSAISMLMLAIAFYRPSSKPPRILPLFLFVVPFFTVLFSFVPKFWPLVYNVDAISESMSAFYLNAAPWFWVHTLFCYSVVLLTTGVVLYGHFRIPKFYRFSSSLIVFAISLIPATHILSIMGLWIFPVSSLGVSLCIAIILSHIALLNSDLNVFVRYARGHIFQHLGESNLVLGEEGYVVDFNPKASEWLGSYGISLLSNTLRGILDALIEKGAEIKEGPDNHSETDIIFNNDDYFEVHSLQTHEIIDRKNRKIGAIAIFTDVTKNRDLFKRLEEKAGMDPLTGLPNRMTYEGARNRLDASEYYPLSVIVCDANGLKNANDRLGHKYGDKMLQLIAESLESVCPKPGFIARIGGDEFIFLLAHTDREKAQTIIKQIQDTLLDRSKTLSYDLSVACGTATKYSEEENLENVISLADARMYEDKKQIKENLADNKNNGYY